MLHCGVVWIYKEVTLKKIKISVTVQTERIKTYLYGWKILCGVLEIVQKAVINR